MSVSVTCLAYRKPMIMTTGPRWSSTIIFVAGESRRLPSADVQAGGSCALVNTHGCVSFVEGVEPLTLVDGRIRRIRCQSGDKSFAQ